jgi:hypothetical protein
MHCMLDFSFHDAACSLCQKGSLRSRALVAIPERARRRRGQAVSHLHRTRARTAYRLQRLPTPRLQDVMASHPSYVQRIYFARLFTPRAVTTHPTQFVHAQPRSSYPPACLRRRRLTFGPFSLSCLFDHALDRPLARLQPTHSNVAPPSHHRLTMTAR